MKITIMQKEDKMSPAFVLQEAPSVQEAKEIVFRLALRRPMKLRLWPVWFINGVKY